MSSQNRFSGHQRRALASGALLAAGFICWSALSLADEQRHEVEDAEARHEVQDAGARHEVEDAGVRHEAQD